MSPETEQIILEARLSLQGAGISRVFLFGSRVHGYEREDSDVDLVVIMDRDEPFASFAERSVVLIDLRRRLSRIASRYGLDLLLFSRPEWEDFVEKGSWFSKEIQSEILDVA
jgi:predicted nucleotidyltransferase